MDLKRERLERFLGNPYPVTIVKDRYTGCYSGGLWNAYMHHCEPDGPGDDDCSAGEFWMRPPIPAGSGDTPDEAFEALMDNVRERLNDDPDHENVHEEIERLRREEADLKNTVWDETGKASYNTPIQKFRVAPEEPLFIGMEPIYKDDPTAETCPRCRDAKVQRACFPFKSDPQWKCPKCGLELYG